MPQITINAKADRMITELAQEKKISREDVIQRALAVYYYLHVSSGIKTPTLDGLTKGLHDGKT